jgi:hypothetical protein
VREGAVKKKRGVNGENSTIEKKRVEVMWFHGVLSCSHQILGIARETRRGGSSVKG